MADEVRLPRPSDVYKGTTRARALEVIKEFGYRIVGFRIPGPKDRFITTDLVYVWSGGIGEAIVLATSNRPYLGYSTVFRAPLHEPRLILELLPNAGG